MSPTDLHESPVLQTPSSSSSSSHSTATNTENPFSQTPQLQNINNFIPIKLKKDNYLVWLSLFNPVLLCYDMLKFIDGSSPCPSPTITATDLEGKSKQIINPDYLSWVKSDQTLMIWINATISEELLPYVVGCSTSRDLWLKLENRLAALSRSHILQLKHRLQSIRKGNSSMAVYLQQIKVITDGLAAAGNIIDDTDLVFHILHGLPSEFDSFSTTIRLREPPITSDVLHSLLISEEICIDNRLKPIDFIPDSSNHAFHSYPISRGSTQNFRGSGRGNRGRGKSPMNHFPNYKPSNLSFNQNQSQYQTPHNKFSSQYFPNTKPVCQICQKPNHSALDCYHRMNYAYAGKNPPPKLHAMTANTRQMDSAANSQNWVLDSGASSHLTNDISQIDNHAPYNGTDQIQIASGDYLPISNIGQHFGDHAFPRAS